MSKKDETTVMSLHPHHVVKLKEGIEKGLSSLELFSHVTKGDETANHITRKQVDELVEEYKNAPFQFLFKTWGAKVADFTYRLHMLCMQTQPPENQTYPLFKALSNAINPQSTNKNTLKTCLTRFTPYIASEDLVKFMDELEALFPEDVQ